MTAAIGNMIHLINIMRSKIQVMLHRDNRQAIRMQLLHEAIQLLLAFEVDAGRRLIKNQQIRRTQKRTRNHYLLALTAAQRTDKTVTQLINIHLLEAAAHSVLICHADHAAIALHALGNSQRKLAVERFKALRHVADAAESVRHPAACRLKQP